jgi:hypothetical protein
MEGLMASNVAANTGERSVIMQLKASALPFLISKALRGQAVELIITDEAVYCAADPVPIPKPPKAPFKPMRSLKSLLRNTQRSATAAAVPAPLRRMTSAAAEVPGCAGAILSSTFTMTANMRTIERMQAAYEAVRVISTSYTDRAGQLLQQSVHSTRAEVAAKFDVAYQVLKAQSLVTRGRAAELYGSSTAVLAAVDAAGRLASAIEKMKAVTSEGSSRARSLFKRAVAFVIAAQAVQRFVTAYESLTASYAISAERSSVTMRKAASRVGAACRAAKKLSSKAARKRVKTLTALRAMDGPSALSPRRRALFDAAAAAAEAEAAAMAVLGPAEAEAAGEAAAVAATEAATEAAAEVAAAAAAAAAAATAAAELAADPAAAAAVDAPSTAVAAADPSSDEAAGTMAAGAAEESDAGTPTLAAGCGMTAVRVSSSC